MNSNKMTTKVNASSEAKITTRASALTRVSVKVSTMLTPTLVVAGAMAAVRITARHVNDQASP